MTARPARRLEAGVVYKFATCQLDVSRRTLSCAGQPVALTGRQMSLLILLLQNAGQLVAKETIAHELWGSTPASDNSIVQVAVGVRKAFAQCLDGGEYIDRHARDGYRFIAPVVKSEYSLPASEPEELLAPYQSFAQGRALLESLDLHAVEPAARAFDAALACDATLTAAHIGLANTLLLNYESTRIDGEPDPALLTRAEGHALKGCKHAPRLADAWSTLALIRHRLGCTLDAVAAMRKALEIDSEDWRLWLRMAWVNWGEERLKACRRVLDAVPDQPVAHWFAATVHVGRGMLPRALDVVTAGCSSQDLQLHTQGAERLRFTSAGLHWLRGLILAAMGEDDEALSELAAETRFEALGHVYAREASVNSWYAIGVLHSRAGRLDEARAAFEQALARAKRHPMTLLHVNPRSLASSSPHSTIAGVPLEAAMVMAGQFARAGRPAEAARLMGEALVRAPYGSAGWVLPIEPTLNVAANPAVWTDALGLLRGRAS